MIIILYLEMNAEKCFLLPLKAQVKANKQINVTYTEGNRWNLDMYYGTE